jgi:hypothetical protein
MTPSDVTNSIDNWVTERSNLAIGELSTSTFSTAVRDNIKTDWESKCDNETLLADVRATLEEYEVSLEALIAAIVADYEKKGYKQFSNVILIKRIGPKVFDGERVLAYSAVQYRYCDNLYRKRAQSFEFDAPGVFVDADGIKEENYSGTAEETNSDGPVLGLREFVFQINPISDSYWKTNDFSGLLVTQTC